MFIKIDYELGFSSICNTENEVIEGCGYEVNGITFEELLERVSLTHFTTTRAVCGKSYQAAKYQMNASQAASSSTRIVTGKHRG